MERAICCVFRCPGRRHSPCKCCKDHRQAGEGQYQAKVEGKWGGGGGAKVDPQDGRRSGRRIRKGQSRDTC